MIIDGTRAADRATEVVLAYYAAFNRGDWDGMLEHVAEKVAHDINQGAREVGREAFEAFLRRMANCYREQLRDIVVMPHASGERVAVEYFVEGEYLRDDAGLPPARGQRYGLMGCAFFALHDGVITRISNYYNLEDWIAQVKSAS